MFYFDLEYFAFAKLNFISFSTSLFLSNNLHISMPAANGMWNKLFWFLSHFGKLLFINKYAEHKSLCYK